MFGGEWVGIHSPASLTDQMNIYVSENMTRGIETLNKLDKAVVPLPIRRTRGLSTVDKAEYHQIEPSVRVGGVRTLLLDISAVRDVRMRDREWILEKPPLPISSGIGSDRLWSGRGLEELMSAIFILKSFCSD